MSGGVDSSTAAYLLKSEGHEVVGLSMQMYDNLTNADSTYGGCCTIDDLADARRVAWKLEIPHFTLNLEQNFHEKVIVREVVPQRDDAESVRALQYPREVRSLSSESAGDRSRKNCNGPLRTHHKRRKGS